MNFFKILLVLLMLFGISEIGLSQSTDWLQWRGPTANSISNETDWSPDEAVKEDAKLWETNVGTGFAAPIIKEDKLYTLGNFEKNDSTFFDRVVCLNTANGEVIWKYEYPCNEFEDPGPFSTPLYNEGMLYTLSREGHFICFNAENGSVIWQHNLMKEGLTTKADSSFLVASAPLVYKDLVILNLNTSGAAFNKKTGVLQWNSEIVESNFNISTPVLFENNNKTMVLIQTEHKTSAVDPLTGKVFWELEGGAMPDPIISDNTICGFTQSGGFHKYQINNDTPELIWKNSEVKCQCQNFVIKDKYAYGFGQAKLSCISLETGERKWGKPYREGALILSNNILIVLDQIGNLVFIETNPEEYTEIARIKAIENPKSDQKERGYRRVSGCFTNPVLSNGKLYLRSSYGILVCMDISNK